MLRGAVHRENGQRAITAEVLDDEGGMERHGLRSRGPPE